jgi:hypothetical protein
MSNSEVLLCSYIKHALHYPLSLILSAFRDRGSLGPTSECRRVPQPRWVEREGEREGGKK